MRCGPSKSLLRKLIPLIKCSSFNFYQATSSARTKVPNVAIIRSGGCALSMRIICFTGVPLHVIFAVQVNTQEP